MTGYVRIDTSNNIADGNIINAADLDGEFDGIQSAFNASTGHTHGGGAGEGAPITAVGPAQDVTVSQVLLAPKTTNTVDLGSSGLKFKDLYVAGTSYLSTLDLTSLEVTNLKAKDGTSAGSIADSTGVVTLASSVLTTADINGGTADNVVIGGSTAAAGTFTTATATTGNITTVNATTVNATTVDTTNIEVTTLKAKDGTAAGSIADSTGVVTLASSVLTTADINGGTVDNVTIGGSTAAAANFTTVGASGVITSTVSTGTAPFTVASTTKVSNLNVDQLDGADWAAPASIGSATPNAAAFTTVSASGVVTSTVSTGTAPFTVASTTKVSNLNVDQLDGADWAAPASIGSATPNAAAFTTVSASGQITSTVSTGTAPLVVASTTKVSNLNADLLDGADWASPSAIGTTTAAAGTFTTLTATADSSFTSTGALRISKGTTAEQPGSPATGMMRYNTSTNQFEGYSGASPAWKSIGGSALSNDTATSTDVYPVFAAAVTGTAENLYTSNAQYLFKPSTGELKVKAPVASNGIVVNADSVAASYTIATGTNGFSVGPITVASGATVTVASGQKWIVI